MDTQRWAEGLTAKERAERLRKPAPKDLSERQAAWLFILMDERETRGGVK